MQVCLILHLATCQKAGVALFNKCVGEKRDCKKTSQSGWLTRVEVGCTAFLKLGRLRLRKTRSNVTLYTGPLLKWAHSAQLNELVSAFCFNFDIFAFATWLPFRWLAHKLECLCVYIYVYIYIYKGSGLRLVNLFAFKQIMNREWKRITINREWTRSRILALLSNGLPVA